MVVETINMVVNDSEHTYKRTDDDDELAPKVTVVLEAIVADIPIANTSINSFKDGSKEVTVEKIELIPSSDVRKNHPLSSII
ncbi:uncharacterized protein E5676_scaffold609G001310 [Cucumis melo var. makuwa]|uniref:Uncharacterized protein n=1 Tax=Cucumis melo var. makuwa TaxID=1194695 RepID=A0A5D3DD09_CUCMM|nr:uncharacterized protein E6C27_scaffold60G001850 [Cucumis melo var. makuwa]TYK21456.1 uncharacterized protein E5676_scaffold609G001310 [Cucumis melo var. makuwa]